MGFLPPIIRFTPVRSRGAPALWARGELIDLERRLENRLEHRPAPTAAPFGRDRKILMRAIGILATLLVVAGLGGSCEGKVEHGKPCGESTVCEGICLVDMPGGICTSLCSVLPCPKGTTCLFIAGDHYCMPTCTQNSKCRTGYTCVLGVCRPPVGPGEACEEGTDCTSGICEGGICSTTCATQNECPDGLYCDVGAGHCVLDSCDAASGVCLRPCDLHEDCAEGTYCTETVTGELRCKVVPEVPPAAGTLGASCPFGGCESGLTCRTVGEGDPDAYCTRACTAEADCNPDMLCRDDGGSGSVCVRRAYCESCKFDGQCGFSNQRCVSSDPAVAPQEAYCSTSCDPALPRTCPLDTLCMEAQFCASTGTWVADCSWCEGQCGPMGAPVHQCFHHAGTCVGDGGLCDPCLHSGHCDEGACLSVFGPDNFGQESLSCTAPCGTGGTCPDGFWCIDVTGLGPQCVPRTGSCLEPSRGKEICAYCSSETISGIIGDCERGICLPTPNLSRCFDFCGTGYPDCPPYMVCKSVTEYGGDWDVCQPNDATPVDLENNCNHWQTCITECPEGPDSCSASAPSYCLP